MYSLQVCDNIKHCCGVGEVYGITKIDSGPEFNSKEVVLAVCAVYLYKKKRAVFLFEDVDSKYAAVGSPVGVRVRALADYISQNGLGIAVLCPSTPNPNTGNMLTLLNWVVDPKGIARFWDTHEPQANEKEWNLIEETTVGTANEVPRHSVNVYHRPGLNQSRNFMFPNVRY